MKLRPTLLILACVIIATTVMVILGGLPALASGYMRPAIHTNRAAQADCNPAWQIVGSPNDPAGDNNLSAVAAVSASDIWSVGYAGSFGTRTALIEHWDGTAWTIVPSPGTNNLDTHLAGVAAVSSTDVWAVGSVGRRALTEHWDGTTWSIIEAQNPSLGGNYLYSVSAVSGSDIWAVGYQESSTWYLTLIEHWDGSAWSVVPGINIEEANNELLSVDALSPNDVWAVGNYAGGPLLQTLAEHWDGTTWTLVASPSPAPWSSFMGIRAIAPDNVWGVGGYSNYNPMGTLIEHWDGSAWTIIPSPDMGPLVSVDAVDGNDIWAAGEVSNTGGTLIEHWDGTAWTTVPAVDTGSNTNYFYGIAVAAPNDVWAVGEYSNPNEAGQTLIERYAGICGTPAPSPSLTPTSGITPIATPSGTATPVPSTTATACAPNFRDVSPSDYFYTAVSFLYCRGAISGYSDGTFRPYNNVTRGQLSKIVVLAQGWTLITPTLPTFSDVPPVDSFYAYVETAYSHAVVSGYADGTFRPYNNVTRGQLSKIVVLAQGWQLEQPPAPTFSDVPATYPFYTYVETAYAHSIISGYSDGTFKPTNSATRGQIAKIVAGALTGR